MARIKSIAAALLVGIVVASLAAPVLAAKGGNGKGKGKGKSRPAVTKMKFKIDDHEVAVGDYVTGTLTLLTRDGKKWVPLAGATVGITVDKVEVEVATTDADGHVAVTWGPAAEGDHVMKAVYAGDDTHRKAQRAQGFSAGAADDDEDEDELEEVLL